MGKRQGTGGSSDRGVERRANSQEVGVAEILEPLWNTCLDACTSCLSADELHAVDAICQRLSHGVPIDLLHPDSESTPVPLQRRYKGHKPVIHPALADIPCSKLTPELLLLCLNSLMFTTFSMTNSLSTLLRSHINEPGMDFGTLYSRVRPHWSLWDLENFERKCSTGASRMDRCRSSKLGENMIRRPDVSPRRLWDLYSNRVVESSLISRHWGEETARSCLNCLGQVREAICAVSHSWAPPDQRINITTSVNNHAWRVPIPSDVSLERVRVELLNLGVEYAWLDVLCLRQEDPEVPGEIHRKVEWALDVPTIGYVYQTSENVVHYFSGLGRPFEVGDLRSDRHWVNRAWTLQEIGRAGYRKTAGITDGSPPDPWATPSRGRGPFYDALASASRVMEGQPTVKGQVQVETILAAFLSMGARRYTSPLDCISGLAYPLQAQILPIYNTDWSLERAWEALVAGMNSVDVFSISMLFPSSGDGRFRFLPSWKQVVEADGRSRWGKLPLKLGSNLPFEIFGKVQIRQHRDSKAGGFQLLRSMRLVRQCQLKGLGKKGTRGFPREGKAILPCHLGGHIQRFCRSMVNIADGTYTLVSFVDTNWVGRSEFKEVVQTFTWLVGRLEDNRFFKESTVEVYDLKFPKDWNAVGESAEGLILM